MLNLFRLTLLACVCLGCLRCAQDPLSPPSRIPRELTASEKRLIEADNTFGFKLFRQITEGVRDENVFISPLSIAMALGMTYNGADGTTREAMQSTLELSGLSPEEVNESYQSVMVLLGGLDPKVRFDIANSIWYRQGFPVKEEFVNLNNEYFNAVVSALDFGDPNASKTINAWVGENTNGRITEIVPDAIDPLTVMFLINAIYFKGTWTYEFDRDVTEDDWFTLPNGSNVRCKMMMQEGNFQYFDNADFQVIDLPYGDGDFSMTVFLPRPGKDISSFIGQFDQDNWDIWIREFSKQPGTVQFPKYTLTYEAQLNEILTALGMGAAFDPSEADFGKMYDEGKVSENVYISQVKHKTFIKVDEEGTEAAAVTSVEMGSTSVGPSGFFMRVDRPFVFVIREDHSQAILFMGKIIEPVLE